MTRPFTLLNQLLLFVIDIKMAFINKFGGFQAQVDESGPEVPVAPIKKPEKQGGGHGKEKKI